MTTRNKIDLFFLCCLLLAILLVSFPVFAGGDDITTDVENVATGGQAFNTMGSQDNESFALGLANTLGGVRIGDCLASTQWSTPVFGKQKVELNYWCAAEAYEARGMHSMAARLRCQIPEIGELFTDANQCIAENTYQPAEVPRGTDEHIVFQNALIDRQDAMRGVLEAEISALRETLENIQKARQRPVVRPVQQVQPFLTDEKRAALAAIRGE